MDMNRKSMMILGVVTAASVVAATLGHMYCREFCIATKPVLWPFVALAALVAKDVILNHKNKKDK